MNCNLIIFTKPYNSSEAKTRLRKAGLTDKFVNQLHNKLLSHTLSVAESFNASSSTVYWHSNPKLNADTENEQHLPKNFEYSLQVGNDFNSRLQNSWDTTISNNPYPTMLIGSDCPGISLKVLNEAKSILMSGKACIGPTPDNGFYLIGLPSNSLNINFETIIYSKNQVEAACKLTLSEMQILNILRDIDEPRDIIECLF